MSARRILKAAEAIREVVGMAILTELRDPRVSDVTVTYVEVARDMRHAKVHVSIMGDERKQQLCMHGLQNAAGFLQRKINSRIETRYTPRIRFVLDEGVKASLEVTRILDDVRADDVLVGDVLADDVRADDVLADDALADDVLAGDVLVGDVLADDVLADDVLADDVLAGDVLAGDVLADDVLADDVLADDVLAGDVRADDVLAGDVLADDVLAGDVRADDALAGDEATPDDETVETDAPASDEEASGRPADASHPWDK